MISDCKATLDIECKLFKNSTTTHLFLQVDDIYTLSKLASSYTWYKIIYTISIVDRISSYEIEISPISEKAYSILNLPLPIL